MSDRPIYPPEPDEDYAGEHPEDGELRRRRSAVARAHVRDFVMGHVDEIAECFFTYGDTWARGKFNALYERFWAELPDEEESRG